MTNAARAAEIARLAAAIKAKSSSSAVDGWADQIAGLAAGIAPEGVTVTERRSGRDRRTGKDHGSMQRRGGQRRGTYRSYRSDVAVSGVVTSGVPLSFAPTDTHQITYVAYDSAGIAVTPGTVAFSSSNSGVASVSGTGLVTGVADGTATITLKADGWTTTIAYPVTTPAAAVDHLVVTPATATLSVGQTLQLSAQPEDASNNALTGRTTTWGSSDTNKATVSAAGVVTAVAATSPTVTITGTCETKTDTCVVTVNAQVQSGFPYAGSNLVLRRDWNAYADEAAYRAQAGVGVYTGQNAADPAQPVSVYSDWIDDPLGVFGKVCRYNYSTTITNTTDLTREGRSATCNLNFKSLISDTLRRHVWVRWFMRFSTDWSPNGAYPTNHANSYKGGFLHWDGAGFRNHWPGWAAANAAGIEYGQAIPSGGSPSPMNVTYYGTPFDGFGDAWAIINPNPGQLYGLNKASFGATNVDGEGQWWEFVMGYKQVQLTGPGRSHSTFACRKYTQSNTVNPGSWVWRGVDATLQDAGLSLVPSASFSLGQNRNKHVTAGEGPYYIYWGPVEIVHSDDNPFLTASERWWAGL